jgi:hypothetical protein
VDNPFAAIQKAFKTEILKEEDSKFDINIEEFMLSKTNNDEINKSDSDKIQVLYCTRTHSQIAQVISEIKKIEKNINQNFRVSITQQFQLARGNFYV